MVFSSLSFLVFFLPLTLIIYYCVPHIKAKNIVLLLSSCLFYAWGEPKYIFLILFSVIVNYFLGLAVANITYSQDKRRVFLVTAIVFNLAVLFVFKYFNFASRVLHTSVTLKLAIPIGISFFTFQILSYVVDVYRNPLLIQKNILNLALYVMFFPQMIAGPIVRYHDINLQIENRKFTLNQFYTGCQRFLLGLAKKVLIANTMAEGCDRIFNTPFNQYGTFYAWVAVIAYTLQIYYDFSGYSDMAIGLGKMFGFDFLENFNYPYMASSIKDFWRRWHISLSSCFKDYVYIPLGGNRKGLKRTILNKYLIFFLTGIWHGAGYNFIIWGLGHGTLMMAEELASRTKLLGNPKVQNNIVFKILKRICTLLCVMLLWVFFRTGTKEAIKIILKLFGINYTAFHGQYISITEDPFFRLFFDAKFFIVMAIGIIFSSDLYKKIRLSEVLKNIILIVLFILSMSYLASSSYNPFIYFRF